MTQQSVIGTYYYHTSLLMCLYHCTVWYCTILMLLIGCLLWKYRVNFLYNDHPQAGAGFNMLRGSGRYREVVALWQAMTNHKKTYDKLKIENDPDLLQEASDAWETLTAGLVWRETAHRWLFASKWESFPFQAEIASRSRCGANIHPWWATRGLPGRYRMLGLRLLCTPPGTFPPIVDSETDDPKLILCWYDA